ncbi:tetratricopeptide repeat protein [Candidatus Chrysopegis kryptomonas]|uniref:Tetratricopeptide repeat-containing protein n=1 Tax=Candidatus Chryseopegocella kryptomonas TaxID=1633643 RepID=A0A0P1NT99_9BACT|nr:tetratricopeptide repeat protein [Candidatus Chrysopegis kryptomonas]CUT02231.1 Tetratricopeptide repeat-containing protein [Candidatus Chrysopegis kryptomonas]
MFILNYSRNHKIKPLLRRLKKFSATILSIIFFGCSIWKSATSEFNAYFNTYYNAKVIFEQVEEVIQNRTFSEKFLSIEKFDAELQLPPNEKNKLDDVIKKCSKILQYYINTSIADDALLMTGKSYFYQDNFTGAERKFAELISTFPNSKLYDEALYYLMLTLSKEKKYNDAIISFQAKAKIEPKNKNLWKLYKIYGLAKFKLGEIDSAIYYLNLASKQAKDEDKAEILFYLGELNEKIDKTESAKFYYETSKLTKRTNLKIYSLIKYATQQRELGNYKLAERVLHDLLYSNIDKDYEKRVYLELARNYRMAGEIDLAIQTYTYLDTTYKRTEESAFGYFELAQIYENEIGNYDSAKVFYEKARLEFPQSKISNEAQRKVEKLNEYIRHRTSLAKNDSILNFIKLNPDSSVSINVDSLKDQIAQTKYALAWIFYTSLNKIDSAIYYLNEIIKNHPQSSIAPRSYYLLGTIYEDIDSSKSREIYKELVKNFPESEFASQVIKFIGIEGNFKKDTLTELYNKAISLIDEDPNKAIEILYSICNHNSNSNLKAKAYYAIGWINEYKLKNFAKAVEHYSAILNNFPNSEYAKIVERKLNPEKQEATPQTKQSTPTPQPEKKQEIKPASKETEEELEDNPRVRERKRRRIDDN